MARKARDDRLETRTARLKLRPAKEPYWRTIQKGQAIGYRRLDGGKSGTWIARHNDPAHGRRYKSLGIADDLSDADGVQTFAFGEAQDRAREWFTELTAERRGTPAKPFTVADAVDHYIVDYTARGGKARSYVETTFRAHIVPTLGEKLLTDLAPEIIRRWHHALALAPARLRAGPKTKVRKVRPAKDADAKRARRATANGILTMLKAALNLAYREGKVVSDAAWRRVQPFRQVDAPRVRFLTDEDSVRLTNACPEDLRALVVAALLTGCRYQELATLRPMDIDLAAGVLTVRHSKAGKPRSAILTKEAVEFFRHEMAGKAVNAVLLPRADGEPWGKSLQFRPLRVACAAAKITPSISFHILRHTHGSRLAMRGVPMAVIAAQLGHASVKVTERHYAHLAPSYIADTIRNAFGALGLGPQSNVVLLEHTQKQ
jgi:integrase